jgi:hypothetical protein
MLSLCLFFTFQVITTQAQNLNNGVLNDTIWGICYRQKPLHITGLPVVAVMPEAWGSYC